MIYVHRNAYYDAIVQSSQDGHSTAFIEFMPRTILAKTREAGDETDQDSDQVTDQVKELLAAFETVDNQALSASELIAAVGLSHRQTFRKNYLHPALAAGLIEMIIPEKPNSSNQKYRFTLKGKHLVNDK